MFDDDKRRIPITSDGPAAGAAEQPVPVAEASEEQLVVLEQVAQLQAALAEAEDGRLRALAEMQNFRRRANQERVQALQYACAPVLSDLIPVLDHFEMATAAAEVSDETRIFCQGYEMILQQLKDALGRHGLEEIPAAEGMFFDPDYHDAVDRVPTEEPCEGTVMRILRKGYRLRDRILRPVQVAVAVRPEGDE